MADEKRTYNSPLREQRAKQTRERILEAALELLGEGAHRMTVPNVAKGAGVSVPTVYRYFPNKEELEDAVVDYVKELVGIRRDYFGLDELEAVVRRNWNLEPPPGSLPLLLASTARNLDNPPNPKRREHVERGMASELSELAPDDREKFVTLVQALGSSLGQVAFARAGLDADESADLLMWMLRTLHGALSRDAND